MESVWIPAVPLAELPEGGSHLFKHADDRVAVFRVDGEVFAVDDRCPHEGFPLTQGDVCGTTLTCCHHNFKFDLRDGACLMGDEAVRSYPARVQDGVIELDLSPPDPRLVQERLWASLEGATREWKAGQLARDAVRLLGSGVEAHELARFAAVHDARFGEYGSTHALPVAADILRWIPRYSGTRAAFPLVQALEIASEFHVRRPERAVPDPLDPGAPETFVERLHDRVEAEDAAAAEAMFRGALAAGWGRDRIEPALFWLCADHFLDYGHALIYTVKSMDLLEATGWEAAGEILPALVYAIVTGTREDVLPAWTGWRRRHGVRDYAALAGGRGVVRDPAGLEAALLSGGAAGEEAVTAELIAGASLRSVAEGLVVAAAIRVLRFDASLEHDTGWQDDWLSVSHVQTFANAVRHAVERAPARDAVRLVFQAVRMIGMTRPLDAADPDWERDPALIEARAELRADPGGLRDTWMDAVISDVATRAIVVAHGIKQVVAAFDDFEATGRPECALAAIRFAAAPKLERRVARATREAVGLVVNGQIPRRRVS